VACDRHAGQSFVTAVGGGRDGSKTFKATLERFSTGRLNWIIARVPFNVEKTWQTRGSFKVNVHVNGFDYRTSLFPAGNGEHYFIVNKKMQKAARIAPGHEATFTVLPDRTPRDLVLPVELERVFNRNPRLRKWFDRLSYSIRRWMSDMVSGMKSPETRRRRAERIAGQIMEAMDAERELPPMIQGAFQKNPEIATAWKQMTDIQRRNTLLAIFYYQTPQSRLRRIGKIVDREPAD
jgi:uncharacterized protein YdeI (YjbR/CyaY-like superfamily)